MGSVFKEKRTSKNKKTGQLQTRIVWGYSIFDGHGKRHKKMVGSKARAELALKKAEHDMFERVHLGKIPEEKPKEQPMPFNLYAAKYLVYSEGHKSRKSYQRDQGIINKYFVPLFKNKPLDQITVEEVEELKQDLLKQWTPGDVIKKMNLLQAMINRAVRLGYLTKNHLKAVEKLKAPPERKRYLKADEKKRLFQELHTPWFLMPVSLMAIYTGMRRGDEHTVGGIVGLRWDDIDLQAKVINLPTTKNDEPLIVPLSKTMIALLESLPRTSDRVFPGVNGNMVTMASGAPASGQASRIFASMTCATPSAPTWLSPAITSA